MNNELTKDIFAPQPRYLWFLILAYAMVFSISNWFDSRLVIVFGLTIPPGTLLYPFTFLLSDIITEVYGFKFARQAIWSALFFNAFFILFGQIVGHLPSPDFAVNTHYNEFLSVNFRIIVASFSAYLISEPLNSILLSKLKIKFKGKYMGFRFVCATFIASFVDCGLFFIFAFSGMLNISQLTTMIASSWMIKVCIEIIGLPFSIRLSKWIKKREEIDMYDNTTTFNLFKFDTRYPSFANHFIRKP